MPWGAFVAHEAPSLLNTLTVLALKHFPRSPDIGVPVSWQGALGGLDPVRNKSGQIGSNGVLGSASLHDCLLYTSDAADDM
eukprot:7077161-Alexandrium_andersonii.AAC.1